jgi:hypothetical protein
MCPLLLQKLTIAEPDTLVTVLSFGALVVWWSGVAAGRLTILHWIGSGFLLAALAMAKGPQPAAFFGLGVLAYLLIERRWRDLPGWVLCMIIPAATVAAWGAAVYRPGDETAWISYARLTGWPPFYSYITHSIHDIGSLYLELLPASLLIPFIPWPWRRANEPSDIPSVVAPMILYSGVCTAILVWWPGFNTRYAMPIAPSLAVLAGVAWDRLELSRYAIVRRAATTILCLLVIYQFVISMSSCRFFTTVSARTVSPAKPSNRRSLPIRRRLIVCGSTPTSSFMCMCRCGVSTYRVWPHSIRRLGC